MVPEICNMVHDTDEWTDGQTEKVTYKTYKMWL